MDGPLRDPISAGDPFPRPLAPTGMAKEALIIGGGFAGLMAIVSTLTALERDVPAGGFLAGAYSIADIALAPLVAKLTPALRPAALGLQRLASWEALVLSRTCVAAVVGGQSVAA